MSHCKFLLMSCYSWVLLSLQNMRHMYLIFCSTLRYHTPYTKMMCLPCLSMGHTPFQGSIFFWATDWPKEWSFSIKSSSTAWFCCSIVLPLWYGKFYSTRLVEVYLSKSVKIQTKSLWDFLPSKIKVLCKVHCLNPYEEQLSAKLKLSSNPFLPCLVS